MILVDTSHLLMRNLFMNIKEIKEGNYNFLAHLILKNILSFKRILGASRVNRLVLTFDSPHTWRKDFYERNWRKLKDFPTTLGYKGNRKKDETINWEKVFQILDDIGYYLNEYSDFQTIKIDNVEADDIIFVGVDIYHKKEKVIIASSDKDFNQLLNYPNTYIYDPIKKEVRECEDPERYLKIQIMIGDKIDNIPAIKSRLGKKTAEKILDNGLFFENELERDKELKKRYLFNKKLIDLKELPIDYYRKIEKEFNNFKFSYNQMGLIEMCRKYKLKNIQQHLNDFFLDNKRVESELVFKKEKPKTILDDIFN